jgi:hypothetical protein
MHKIVLLMPCDPARRATGKRPAPPSRRGKSTALTTPPPLAQCVDTISFREHLDPQAPYLLLDDLSNGGHKRYDGNSIPRLIACDRIWLADSDDSRHLDLRAVARPQTGRLPHKRRSWRRV